MLRLLPIFLLFCSALSLSDASSLDDLALRSVEHLKRNSGEKAEWLFDLLELDENNALVPKQRSKRFVEATKGLTFKIKWNIDFPIKTFTRFPTYFQLALISSVKYPAEFIRDTEKPTFFEILPPVLQDWVQDEFDGYIEPHHGYHQSDFHQHAYGETLGTHYDVIQQPANDHHQSNDHQQFHQPDFNSLVTSHIVENHQVDNNHVQVDNHHVDNHQGNNQHINNQHGDNHNQQQVNNQVFTSNVVHGGQTFDSNSNGHSTTHQGNGQFFDSTAQQGNSQYLSNAGHSNVLNSNFIVGNSHVLPLESNGGHSSNLVGGNHAQTDHHIRKRAAQTERTGVYQMMENLLEHSGLPGRECFLRSVCEVAETPFEEDLLGLLINTIFSPAKGGDVSPDESYSQYLEAESHGFHNGSCEMRYAGCPQSMFSVLPLLRHEFLSE